MKRITTCNIWPPEAVHREMTLTCRKCKTTGHHRKHLNNGRENASTIRLVSQHAKNVAKTCMKHTYSTRWGHRRGTNTLKDVPCGRTPTTNLHRKCASQHDSHTLYSNNDTRCYIVYVCYVRIHIYI